ncbi:hypothetical protein HPP92_007249 [Vanilla planifolia]|uniref:Uncharacterized protein n=1 Tax=Vanilla planifolia TaxID=51239 RepID=A0A835V8I3_VANPL|nr:hypothetical protein HPP92_007249 [Vanilla planifolia]
MFLFPREGALSFTKPTSWEGACEGGEGLHISTGGQVSWHGTLSESLRALPLNEEVATKDKQYEVNPNNESPSANKQARKSTREERPYFDCNGFGFRITPSKS